MISLDVFDTAIFRKVYKPTDIFKIINDKAFYNKRIEAEQKAYKEVHHPNIQKIYSFLPEYNMNVEINAELENIEANPEILEMYNRNPMEFIFISDMYLPSKVIEQMLIKVGYINPRVFVSNEYKSGKGSGTLFNNVKKILGEEITLHYGDNYMSDIVGAKKAGIKGVFKPAMKDLQLSLPEVNDPYLKNYVGRMLLSSQSGTDEDIIKAIAKIMTPIYVDFTKWVLNKRTSKNQKIFFLARDMIIPYLISKNVFKAKNVEYIYANRRSLETVIRKSKDPEFNQKLDALELADKPSPIKEIKEYFDKFSMNENDIIVDIGYAGTAVFALQELYNIKLKGLFMKKNSSLNKKLDIDAYFSRPVIMLQLLVESFISSDEDCLIGYSNGEPIFEEDSNKRKRLARITIDTVMETVNNKELLNKKFQLFDLEQVLIYLQLYCPDNFLPLYNEPIIHNRHRRESIINFDKDRILDGELLHLYEMSYAKPLFKRMIKLDKDLQGLDKYLY